MSLRCSEEEYARYLASQNRAAVQAPHVEPNPGHAAAAANVCKKAHPRYRVEVHSRRRRCTDADAVSAKWALDGLVAGGILPDDSPEWIESVSFSQEISDTEQTIISIYENT